MIIVSRGETSLPNGTAHDIADRARLDTIVTARDGSTYARALTCLADNLLPLCILELGTDATARTLLDYIAEHPDDRLRYWMPEEWIGREDFNLWTPNE